MYLYDLERGVVEIMDGRTPESDTNHPIGTSHCTVLRDVHMHSKPEMTGYTTKQVAISIRNKHQGSNKSRKINKN